MISGSQCWHLKSLKQTHPYPKRVSTLFLRMPHTYVQQWLFLWNKAKPMLLTYWEETKQPRRPIAVLPLLEFSPALESWSDIYTSPSSCLIVTPIVTKYYRTHYDQWCCLYWMPRHDKSLTVNCCHVLFMTYWHKFQMIFNGHFVASTLDRPRQDNCLIRCRHGVSLLWFRRHFPLLFFLSFCRRSANVRHVHWALSPLHHE